VKVVHWSGLLDGVPPGEYSESMYAAPAMKPVDTITVSAWLAVLLVTCIAVAVDIICGS